MPGNGLLYARRSGQGDLEPDGEAMASVCRMPRGRTISARRASREPPPKECIHVGLRLPLAVTADAGYPGRSSQVARKRRHLIDLARVEGHPAVIWITLVYFPAQNSIKLALGVESSDAVSFWARSALVHLRARGVLRTSTFIFANRSAAADRSARRAVARSDRAHPRPPSKRRVQPPGAPCGVRRGRPISYFRPRQA
jgi:hypothetical protein